MGTVTPLALLLLFGSNSILYLSLWSHERLQKQSHAEYELVSTSNEEASKSPPRKKLSGPLKLSTESFYQLCSEVFRFGIVLLIVYTCEKHPPFPHESKVHDMDTYWCLVFLLAVVSFLNIHKGKSTDVLNREQTEEWKGWMQFVFLLYHYFSAHEVYNAVRVMITSYVWMTGFGNFSFFYLKGDYGIVRLLQMLWRLNFLVSFLCMLLGNTYILYYICPLHTFYFLMVYVIMRCFSQSNYSKAIRVKLLVAAGLIYLVWDANVGIFQKLFFFLDTTPKIGAGSGTMWEWYFRSSLDHWSTFFGMIYALNYPITALWIKKVEALPANTQWLIKGSAMACLATVFVWWAACILPQPKLQYNDSNAYFGVLIPLLTYIFFRNISVTARTHYLEPLHSIGKITLETYLMQHHVWLTSNAKTVLSFIPHYPRLNMVATSVMYILISKELYRLTMSLRGMILPDSLKDCLKNLFGVLVSFLLCFGIAHILVKVEAGPFIIFCSIVALGLFSIFGLHYAIVRSISVAARSPSDVVPKKQNDLMSAGNMKTVVIGVLTALGGLLLFLAVSGGELLSSASHEIIGPHDHCLANINNGHWETDVGGCSETHMLYCDSHEWRWMNIPDDCHFRYLQPSEISSRIAGRHLVFIGDSTQRNIYYAAIRSLGYPTNEAHDNQLEKHTDLSWAAPNVDSTFSFLWAPYAQNITERIAELAESSNTCDSIAIGFGLWDALHVRIVKDFKSELEKMNVALSNAVFADTLKILVTTNAVVEERLSTEKQGLLTNKAVDAYRKAASSSSLMNQMSAIIDGYEMTRLRMVDSYDGVHYADFVYDAVAQLLGNVLSHYGWHSKTENPSMKRIGSMSHSVMGLVVILIAAIMIFTMDAYHGIAKLFLYIFSRESIDWNEAYGPLLVKMNKRARAPGGESTTPRSKPSSMNAPAAPAQLSSVEMKEIESDQATAKHEKI